MSIAVNSVRGDFPILSSIVHGKRLAYLDNAATTQKPKAVIEQLESFYASLNSNIHRGVHHLSEQASAAYESARESVRAFVNARSTAEIVFTHGTTSAINLVAHSFGEACVEEGDEIIVTEMEHHSNLIPWQMLCKRKRASLRVIPFDDDGRLLIGMLESLVNERTRLIACGYVSNVLGAVHPVEDIVAYAHSRGVPVLIDAAQAVHHLPVDVRELDCDFLAFSGHKMYAATGVGVLYAKRAWLDRLPPSCFGGGMVASVGLERAAFAEPPLKFEAGTPPIAAAVSLGTAVRYLESLGREAVAEHERSLLDHALERLSALDGVTVYGNGVRRCGAVSFNLDGVDSYDIGMVLDKLGIAVRTGTHCAEPVMAHYGITGTVRASFALYNTHEEIERLIEGLCAARSILQ